MAGPIGSIGEDEGYVYLPGGTRDTDSVFCLAGSLHKIIYPTKGYTIFDMEVNKAEDERLIHKLGGIIKIQGFIYLLQLSKRGHDYCDVSL